MRNKLFSIYSLEDHEEEIEVTDTEIEEVEETEENGETEDNGLKTDLISPKEDETKGEDEDSDDDDDDSDNNEEVKDEEEALESLTSIKDFLSYVKENKLEFSEVANVLALEAIRANCLRAGIDPINVSKDFEEYSIESLGEDNKIESAYLSAFSAIVAIRSKINLLK